MKQRHIAALLAEAIGTFVLVMVVLNVNRYQLPFFTAIAAGLTIAAFVSIFFKISGGHFNPAITIGAFSIRQISAAKMIGYIAAQALGAVAGWQLFQYFTDSTLKNATTAFDWRVFLAEAIGAFIFSMGVVAVWTQKLEKWHAAATIGTALFLGATVASLASNGLVNPALALGVRSFDLNYFLGPVVGFVVGSILFAYFLFPIFTVKKEAKATAAPAKVAEKSAPAPKKVVAKKAPAKKVVAKKSTKK